MMEIALLTIVLPFCDLTSYMLPSDRFCSDERKKVKNVYGAERTILQMVL